jgi:hypothetical protein
LRFEQNIVRPADHDQMFDIVAPHENELSLPVETESVHKTKSRLSRPPARHAQPMRENETVDRRQHRHCDDGAARRQSDLDDLIVAERKFT